MSRRRKYESNSRASNSLTVSTQYNFQTKTEKNHSVSDSESRPSQLEANDGNLLDQVRTQWQFGDWDKLTQLKRDTIEKHPERAKLAIFAAAGYQQLDDIKRTKEFVKAALEWGCDKRLVNRVLIGGVYNTLGKVAAILKNEEVSLQHFAEAVSGISGDKRLSCQARSVHEITRLGLLNQAASLVEKEVNLLSNQGNSSRTNQHINVLRTELDLLHQELSLAQQRNQLATKQLSIETKYEAEKQSDRLIGFKNKSVSQLGQDLWVLEKLNYKRNGFFVEFGATDGVLLSNTYLLEKEFDWRGICAEPNPKLYTQLQKNRSCVCKNTCIAGTDNEEREFILADAYGSLASYEGCDHHKQKRQAYRETGEVIKVRTQTLDSFLKSCNAPQEIDYLSIDTEGSELEILEAFDFDYWQIKLITVEHNFQEEPRQKIRELLSRFGYQVQAAQWDDWFWHPDLLNNVL